MKKHFMPLLNRYVRFIENNALLTLLTVFLLTIGAGIYAYQYFSINSSLDGLIKPSDANRWYSDNEQYKKSFPQYQNTAVVVISSASAKEARDFGEKVYASLKDTGDFSTVFAPAYEEFFKDHILYGVSSEGVRQIAKQVTEHLDDIGVIYQSPSIVNLTAFYRDKIEQDRTIEALTHSTMFYLNSLNRTLTAISNEQFNAIQFVERLDPRDTGEHHYQLIIVKSIQNFSEKLPNQAIINDIKNAISLNQIPQTVKVRVTGEIALANDEITAGLSGVEVSGTISFILLFLILFLGVRYKRLISGIFLMLFTGMIWTMALGTFFVGAFNTLSLIFLVMFFGLAIDFAVHYSLRWLEASSLQNNLSVTPGLTTTQDISSALFLCAITSSVAFLAFLPTAYKGLAELGMISAMGMLVALFLTLTFLPAWFTLFKRSRPLSPLKFNTHAHKFLQIDPKKVLIISAFFVVIATWFSKQVDFDYSVLAMQDEQTEAVTTLMELQENEILTDYSISVILDENNNSSEIIKQLNALPTVAKVETPFDFIPKFQEIKRSYMQPVDVALSAINNNSRQSKVAIEKDIEAIQGFILFLERAENDFYDEDSKLLNDIKHKLNVISETQSHILLLKTAISVGINSDVLTLRRWFQAKPFTIHDLPPTIKHRFIASDGSLLINVLPAVEMTNREDMTEFIQEVSKIAPNIAGRSVVEWGVGETVKQAFVEATSLAVGLIFILLLLYFSSVRLSILVLIPILMTALFTFCIIHFTDLTLNMANILVVPLIFGLGVDTGLHVIHRYENSTDMSLFTQSSTSRAVIISAMTTVGTFFSLSFSPHKGASSIGILLSLSIVFLLIVTFFVLPALLRVFRAKNVC